MVDFVAAVTASWEACIQNLTGLTAAWRAELVAEVSDFVRWNAGRVRQGGTVEQAELTVTLMLDGRSGYRRLPLTGVVETDIAQLQQVVAALQQQVPQLPRDPFLVLPAGSAQSHVAQTGQVPSAAAVVPQIVQAIAGLDFTGLYAAGPQVRAYADSAGQSHWFYTETFTLDYSLFNEQQRAVKGYYADRVWDEAVFASQIETFRNQLALLGRPAKVVSPGRYRTYLAPAAVADLVGMLSWSGVSEAAMQQGVSALLPLRRGERRLASAFSLRENFQAIPVPQFNDQGDWAPAQLDIIRQGQLAQTLVSSRTAKEYGLAANGAVEGEYLRAPEVQPGTMPVEQVLAMLERGLYVSNLHYLNWSDQAAGRVTGMTRYACFWVEGGEIVAPIENLRFDDSLYHFWGEGLVALTQTQEFIPATDTYDQRSLGGTLAPGMLVEDFQYTL
ncbi:MAG: metallopeptidase TldD-related protein [Gloeomargarita sp. SKYB31]|nr:metallopeptidase TldD-related protein [Gloeomargarita sp. SKYB31]